MKNLIIVVLLVSVFATPLTSFAQTVSAPLTQEEINAQLQTLLNSLLAQVQDLLAKVTAMQAKQDADSQTLGAVQQQVASSSVYILNPNVPVVPDKSLTEQAIQDYLDKDKIAEMVANIQERGNPGAICVGRTTYSKCTAATCKPGDLGEAHNNKAQVKQNRLEDPIFDKACKKLGY